MPLKKVQHVSRKIRVGDRIAMPLLGKKVFATVIEDRGYIGINGRRLLRIRQQFTPEIVQEYEVPEEEVLLAPFRSKARAYSR